MTALTVLLHAGLPLAGAVACVSLVLLGLWAYHFPKIGVAFMPALDEGRTLDMPVTVPRVSVTQAADDLKARDALLRGFPEVESVIGKAGRADTPTDPAPLDMVETFVNFRPKELWPKRVLRFADADRQTRAVLAALEERGFVLPRAARGRPRQPGQRRHPEGPGTVRRDRCASWPCGATTSSSDELGPAADAVRRRRRRSAGSGPAGDLHWPEGVNEEQRSRRAGRRADAGVRHRGWRRIPPLEDVTRLSQEMARPPARRRAPSTIAAAALALKETLLPAPVEPARRSCWAPSRKTFAGEVLQAVTQPADGPVARARRQRSTGSCSTAASKPTPGSPWKNWPRRPATPACSARRRHGAETRALRRRGGPGPARQEDRDGEAFAALRRAARTSCRSRSPHGVFLWPRQSGPKGDLVDDEMGRVLQVPGWSNIFTQPIINRIEMLSTGVRTDIGVKVFGPDLDTIDRVCKEIEAALKPINGARDVVAAPIMGKGYLEIDIDREKAARYGISVEDIQNTIEVALGGRAVTQTVEDRERFPVRIRYARANREDEETVRRLLVSGSGMAAPAGTRPADGRAAGGSGALAAPRHAPGGAGARRPAASSRCRSR